MLARSEEPTEPAWQRTVRVLFLSAFSVLVIASCCTGRLPQAPLAYHGQDCGSVSVSPNGIIENDPQPPENCLVLAFMRCQVASLTFNWSGTDTGESHRLQVVPSARGCQVEDRPTFSSAVPGLVHPGLFPPMYDCESVQSIVNGLAVKGCKGEDDFVIPLYPAIIGQGCGRILSTQGEIRSDPPDASHCFWQAYTRCQAATLIVYPSAMRGSRIVPPTTLFISFKRSSNSACVISLVERYEEYPDNTFIPHTCAELIERGAQLVVSACGTLGDVVISLAPSATPL